MRVSRREDTLCTLALSLSHSLDTAANGWLTVPISRLFTQAILLFK